MKLLQLLLTLHCLLISELNALTQLLKPVHTQANSGKIFQIENNNTFNTRIVGGRPTNIQTFPYQGSLQLRNIHNCGCVIISKNIVLTAAHCTANEWNTALYKVRVGSTDYRYGGQLINVKRIISHEYYDSKTLDYDIALISLTTDIIYSTSAMSISLAKSMDNIPAQGPLWVSGWGLTSVGGGGSTQLRYVEIWLIDQQSCIETYRNVAPITERMFCAGTGASGGCKGDSGGPLIGRSTAPGENVRLFGIVSWGIGGCAQGNYPSVFVRISAFEQWIDATVFKLNWS